MTRSHRAYPEILAPRADHAHPAQPRQDFDEARDAELRRFMRAVARRRSAYEDDLDLRPRRGDRDVSTAEDLAFD